MYDVQQGKLVCKGKGDKNKCLDATFDLEGDTVLQVGVKYIRFHQLQGRNIKTRKAIISKGGKIQPFLVAAYRPDKAPMVGTADGHLYVFDDRSLAAKVKAHETCVNAIYCGKENIVTGGKDQKVKVWSPSLDALKEFDMVSLETSLSPSVRSVVIF